MHKIKQGFPGFRRFYTVLLSGYPPSQKEHILYSGNCCLHYPKYDLIQLHRQDLAQSQSVSKNPKSLCHPKQQWVQILETGHPPSGLPQPVQAPQGMTVHRSEILPEGMSSLSPFGIPWHPVSRKHPATPLLNQSLIFPCPLRLSWYPTHLDTVQNK